MNVFENESQLKSQMDGERRFCNGGTRHAPEVDAFDELHNSVVWTPMPFPDIENLNYPRVVQLSQSLYFFLKQISQAGVVVGIFYPLELLMRPAGDYPNC